MTHKKNQVAGALCAIVAGLGGATQVNAQAASRDPFVLENMQICLGKAKAYRGEPTIDQGEYGATRCAAYKAKGVWTFDSRYDDNTFAMLELDRNRLAMNKDMVRTTYEVTFATYDATGHKTLYRYILANEGDKPKVQIGRNFGQGPVVPMDSKQVPERARKALQTGWKMLDFLP